MGNNTSIRCSLLSYAKERYGTEPEYPWASLPNYCVLRHADNQKWYGLIMDIPAEKLGLPSKERVDILDVKLDPILVGSLLSAPGFFPAYHMNRDSWITVLLDGSVKIEEIIPLLDLSYSATAEKNGLHT